MFHKSSLTVDSAIDTDPAILWELFGTHLERLPFTWPKDFASFRSWLHENIDDGYPRRYVIFDRSHGSVLQDQIAGIISADLVDEDSSSTFQLAQIGDVNISYMTANKHSQKGVASFALGEVVNKVIAGGHHPILRIASWNKASIRVAEKCGFILAASDIVIQYAFDEEPTLLNVYRYSGT